MPSVPQEEKHGKTKAKWRGHHQKWGHSPANTGLNNWKLALIYFRWWKFDQQRIGTEARKDWSLSGKQLENYGSRILPQVWHQMSDVQKLWLERCGWYQLWPLPITESLPLEGFHLRHLRLLDFVVSLWSRDPESTATVSVLRVYCNEVLHPGTLLFSSHNTPSTENPAAWHIPVSHPQWNPQVSLRPRMVKFPLRVVRLDLFFVA